MKYYHMIIERPSNWWQAPEGRREYISTKQGSAPDGWVCVAVCGYHEKPNAENVEKGESFHTFS